MSNIHPPPGGVCTCPICCPAKYTTPTVPIPGGISWSPDYKSSVKFRDQSNFVVGEVVPQGTTKKLEAQIAGLNEEIERLLALNESLNRQLENPAPDKTRVKNKGQEIARLKSIIRRAYMSDRYNETDMILDAEIQSWDKP